MTLNLVIGSLLGVSGKGSFLPKWGYSGRDDLFSFWMPSCLNTVRGGTAEMVLSLLGTAGEEDGQNLSS